MRNRILLAATLASGLMLSGPATHAAAPDSVFDVVVVAISPTTWASIKYNTVTGEAWSARDGKWVAIKDKESLPEGTYIVKMTGLSNDWAAMRLDVKTGRTWQCREDGWVEITLDPGKKTVDVEAATAPKESK